MPRINGLEIDQDLEFEKKEWRIHRIVLILLTLVLLLGLLGLFGTGPVSTSTVTDDAGTLSVGYERFTRHTGEASLEIGIDGSHIHDGQVEVWLDAAYIDDIQLHGFSQEPNEVRRQGDRLVFAFLADEGTSDIRVTMSFSPDSMGIVSGDAGIVNGPVVSFTQFVYP